MSILGDALYARRRQSPLLTSNFFKESLKDYFSQFGEVYECTVMRDGATGRSRGFGFLTFKDPRTVNIVMVKEHYLDGKIVRPSISTSSNKPFCRLCPSKRKCSHLNLLLKIDPKRAIPRDEQERTSKIFVGGVSQDASEQDFKEYFMQYGRVVDATLMMDKDTGRPRGFGFVTFDNESAVDATLQGDLMILGKPIEVKKAQPRGNVREEEDPRDRRGGRRGGKDNDRFRDDRGNYDNNNNNGNNYGGNQSQNQNQQGNQAFGNGITPQVMAQYFQKMQQYFATQMAAVAAAQNGGMAGAMGMGAMNPAMVQQMKQMQAMQQMQQMAAMQMQQQQQQPQLGRQQGSQSPHPQSPNAMAMQGMNPAMLQQMQQIQQMQMQSQQVQSGAGFNNQMNGNMAVPTGPAMGNSGNQGGRRGTPGYTAQEQLMFEQQKYEQQQARRAAQEAQQMQYQQGGPTSWEGMYDDVPQPNMGGAGGGRGMHHGGGYNRQASQSSSGGGNKNQQQNRASQGPQSAPPANAPTGPKNAGVPGANYRGGGRMGGHRGGFHPYARK